MCAPEMEGEFPFAAFIRQRLEGGSTDVHAEAHSELDRILLQAALRFTDGNQHKAAKVLGLARQTLRLRLRELRISVTKTVEEEQGEGE
jgi:DNA-binding protein Fis